VGQTWRGVTVVSVEHDHATVQIDGQNRTLALGQHYRGTPPPSTRETVTLAADPRGHFFTDATINDMTVRSVVDTGASVAVLSVNDANRLGLDWRNGTRGLMQTANGTTSAYVVKLSKVRVDAIVGRLCRPAGVAVADAHLDVAVAHRAKPLGRRVAERFDQLDAVDLPHYLGKHRCLVTRAGADFQHHMLRLRREQIGRERDDVGLRDRLAIADRQRPVGVRGPHLLLRYQPMPLDLAHRGAHRGRHGFEAGLALGVGVHGLDLGDHAASLRGEILGVGGAHAQQDG